MSYLEKIKGPDDVKKLSTQELELLSIEIRDFIEDVVFRVGGHLSSNLGVIEISIALHYVFDFFADDKIVFDVSHQSYPHKILTGRKDIFHTLRQRHGLCGFTDPKENKADTFLLGHAGTALSLSLGIASGKRLSSMGGKTIALVGDAALSAGMSFEALNHAGHLNENLIVILNDNGMSISQSTGSFAKYLNKIRLSNCYQEAREEIKSLVTKIPKLGESVKEALDNLATAIKRQVGVDGRFFTALDFEYFGPFDGHDISLLIDSLKLVKNFKKPVLLHIITNKGNGHKDAMNNPEKFHGIAPPQVKEAVKENKLETTKKEIEQNKSIKQSVEESIEKVAFTNVFADSLVAIAKKDLKVIGITAAMPGGTGLSKFKEHYPDRFFDVAICEQHALGLAAGQSSAGLKPVCAIYSTFTQRAYDQIFQEVCLNARPVLLATDRAGVVGEDGATHAGVFDISFLRCMPNMVLMSPKDGLELKAMLEYTLRLNKYPTSIRFPRDKTIAPKDYNQSTADEIEFGKGEVLRHGCDIVLVGYGPMSLVCLLAADILADMNINATVINPRFAKPIDTKLVSYALEHNSYIITVEDHSIIGGFGSCFLEEANKISKASFNLYIHGVPDKFVPHGKRQQILKELNLDVEGIVELTKKLIKKEIEIFR